MHKTSHFVLSGANAIKAQYTQKKPQTNAESTPVNLLMNVSVLSCRAYCIFWHTSKFFANMMFPEHWLTLQGWQGRAEKSRPWVLEPSRLQQNTNSSTQQPKSSELCSYL
jgi:hypothetical protein